MKETKGFKNKVRIVVENMKNACKENSEKEKNSGKKLNRTSLTRIFWKNKEKKVATINRECKGNSGVYNECITKRILN